MASLATVAELKARCDWTFDTDEERVAAGYLEEASDLARSYGRDSWEPNNVPRMAKNIVLSSVRRFMRNPDGYTTSRAGDETLAWADNPEAGTIYLTKQEQKLLRAMAGSKGLHSAGLNAWNPDGRTTRFGYPEQYTVPVAGYDGEKAFPYFGHESEPW